ncbi:MAG: OmpH family outer membrane protein [Pseudomonadota bacterium]
MAQAQTLDFPVYDSGPSVATIDRERLLNESAYGQAITNGLAQRQSTLVEENEALLKGLEEEERALTETRRTMDPEAFAPLAEAFDSKANSIRAQQEAKALDLAQALEASRLTFFRDVEPTILEVMRDRGVSILLNEQAVLISVAGVDITDAVLVSLDKLFAEGQFDRDP